MSQIVSIGGGDVAQISVGQGQPLALFCGPCVIESREHALEHAAEISKTATSVGIPLIYKSSYDKANRTSVGSFRGVGLEEGLEILLEVRRKYRLPVVTDVHSPDEALAAAKVADVIQIPAFLCRQTDLLVAAGNSGKPVLVKKGQFLHPDDMEFCVGKIKSTGNSQVMLCERGTSFGYRELIVDMRSFEMMRQTEMPVVFDATHSVQIIGGAQGKSSGRSEFVSILARAAVAAGVDGVFVESHKDPAHAPSDGPNMIDLARLPALLRDLKALHDLSLETRR